MSAMTIIKDLFYVFLIYLRLLAIYILSISASLFVFIFIVTINFYIFYPSANIFYPSSIILLWFWCITFLIFLPIPMLSITTIHIINIYFDKIDLKKLNLAMCFMSIITTFAIIFLLSRRPYRFMIDALTVGSTMQPALVTIAFGNIFYFYLFYKIFVQKSKQKLYL